MSSSGSLISLVNVNLREQRAVVVQQRVVHLVGDFELDLEQLSDRRRGEAVAHVLLRSRRRLPPAAGALGASRDFSKTLTPIQIAIAVPCRRLPLIFRQAWTNACRMVKAPPETPFPVERLEELLRQLVVDLVEESERGLRAVLHQLARRSRPGVIQVERDAATAVSSDRSAPRRAPRSSPAARRCWSRAGSCRRGRARTSRRCCSRWSAWRPARRRACR